jgi:hypothetical protein
LNIFKKQKFWNIQIAFIELSCHSDLQVGDYEQRDSSIIYLDFKFKKKAENRIFMAKHDTELIVLEIWTLSKL